MKALLILIANLTVIVSFQHTFPCHSLRAMSSHKTIQPLRMDLLAHSQPFASIDASASAVQDHLSSTLVSPRSLAGQAVAAYSKVDKTGIIGAVASYMENGIDCCREILRAAGVQNAYGLSIIMFTVLLKAATLPLTMQQMQSASRAQKLVPLQQIIQSKFTENPETMNKLLSQLSQAAQINPLADGILSLMEIPIFISLRRTITNLIAENKLSEPFLWIPNLQGPTYSMPSSGTTDWLKSIFTGAPELGWHDTIAFLSFPLLLYAAQLVSDKIQQSAHSPADKVLLTEREQILAFVLSLVAVYYSAKVPAGLALYLITKSVLSTFVTSLVRSRMDDIPLPAEVDEVMALVDAEQATKGAAASEEEEREEVLVGMGSLGKGESRRRD